jgi:hypothetical protein
MHKPDLYLMLRNASKAQLTAIKRVADNSTREEFMSFMDSNFEDGPAVELSADEMEALRGGATSKPCWCYTSRSSMYAAAG